MISAKEIVTTLCAVIGMVLTPALFPTIPIIAGGVGAVIGWTIGAGLWKFVSSTSIPGRSNYDGI